MEPGTDRSPLMALAIWVAFFVLFSFADSWGACVSGNYHPLQTSLSCQACNGGLNTATTLDYNCEYGQTNCGFSSNGCSGSTCMCNTYDAVADAGCPETLHQDNSYYTDLAGIGNPSRTGCWSLPASCFYQTRCDNQCEADSIACINNGGSWEYTGASTCDGKSCNMIDTTKCDDYRRQCETILGGHFTGSVNKATNCCIGICDFCGNFKQALELKNRQCCNQGLAPPDSVYRCDVSARQTCGMNTSIVSSRDNEFECQDPGLDSVVLQRYIDKCYGPGPGSSSSEGGPSSSSSSDESSSSSDGGLSSSGEGGCEECKWLDSILDTLTQVKWNTDDIVMCLTTPNLCAGLNSSDTSSPFQFDTAWMYYIRPFLDTTLRLDSVQLKVLRQLDTNMLKSLKNDTLQLENETLTRRVISGGISTLDSTIDASSDTTRKWLKRIADSIGVSTDSLVKHLDSILRHIPDSILDSIAKYQVYANDNLDSILFGKGKGFSLVDSLIDSTVRYFKLSHHYDSIYREMFQDLDSLLGHDLGNMPQRNASAIGRALGYGDTASSNLRGDLNGIRDAIEGLGDGLGSEIANGLDSAWSEGSALGDSGYGRYGSDSSDYADVLAEAYGEGDSAADSSYAIEDDTCTTIDCIVENSEINVDSIGQAFQDSLASTYAMIEDSSATWFDSLRQNLKFLDFDSVLVAPLASLVPNTNACPEECFRGSISTLAGFKSGMSFDFGLCRMWNIGGVSINALLFVRLLLRILTAVCCIYIGLWFIAGRR